MSELIVWSVQRPQGVRWRWRFEDAEFGLTASGLPQRTVWDAIVAGATSCIRVDDAWPSAEASK